jgi:hypothetical protein
LSDWSTNCSLFWAVSTQNIASCLVSCVWNHASLISASWNVGILNSCGNRCIWFMSYSSYFFSNWRS